MFTLPDVKDFFSENIYYVKTHLKSSLDVNFPNVQQFYYYNTYMYRVQYIQSVLMCVGTVEVPRDNNSFISN